MVRDHIHILRSCLLILLLSVFGGHTVFSQANIVKAEYFYDSDPGFGNGTNISITPGSTVSNVTFSSNVTDLSVGIHQLFIRVKDADGNWSVTNRSFLYKPGTSSFFVPQVVKAEYFFDNDPGFGNGVNIPVSAGTILNDVSFNASINALSTGIHQMFVRVKDGAGNWSVSNRTFFYKPGETGSSNYQIVKAEYFFDNEPGFGNGTDIPVTPGIQVLDRSFTADLSLLSVGIHQMFIRVKDANGNWSVSNRTFFYKPGEVIAGSSQLVQAEYFFDTEPGFGNGTPIPVTSGVQLLNVGFNADISSLTSGVHQLFIRVKDGAGNWSITNRNFFYKAPSSVLQSMKIVRAEYFIDNDPGFGKAIPYPMSSTSILSDSVIAVNVGGLSDGTHRLYLRTLDNLGRWSITNVSSFNVTAAPSAPHITVTGINKRNLCAGDTIEIGYHASGTFNTGNQFMAELSDASGSFTNAQIIGTVNATVSGSIFAVIPSGLSGSGYKIRVSSSDPSVNSAPFAADLVATCISNVPPVIILNNITHLNCGGVLTGAVDISVSGGNAPYSYLWTKTGSPSFTAATQDLSNVNTGEYVVTVTDAAGNTEVMSFVINGPVPLTAVTSASPISCNGASTGSALVTVSGGVAPYRYLWSNGDSVAAVSGLSAGSHTVTVTDNNGCTVQSVVNILQPLPLTVNVTGTDINCQGIATGTASVTVSGGNPPYSYLWSNGAVTQNISSLLAGTYNVTVRDATGCVQTGSVTLNDLHNAPAVSITASGATTFCQGDSVLLTSSVASSYLWSNAATTRSVYAKNAGSYTVTVTDANGCSATSAPVTISLTPAPVWYIDADGDGYGTGTAITQCNRPPHGFLATELTSVNGDCNDVNAGVNASRQYFRYSDNAGYTTKVISQLTGSSYTDFRFEVDYVDSSNNLPLNSFPRVILDYEGDGNYTGPNDRVLVMTADDPGDLNTSDGKRYTGTINGLPYGSNWKTSILVADANNCITRFGTFDYPDVLQQPNITIFANDISFSKRRPDPGEAITVSALIHNESDYAAQNFVVHLINQFDTTIVYPDMTVGYIAPHGTATVVWNINTPSVPAWCPMQVRIDYTNVITEWNELDNSAVRPFVNGNFPVPGNIIVSSSVSPKVSYTGSGNYINVSGFAYYTGTAVPLPDSSVAGATVDVTIVETGATFSGYTNSAGYFSVSLPSPIPVGTYHITGTITDYTLEGNFSNDFSIIPWPIVQVCTLPDLNVTLQLSQGEIVQGNSVNVQAVVSNSGATAVTTSTILQLSQSGGSALPVSSISIPPLASGQSYTASIGSITYNVPGVHYIYANADANNQVAECGEGNNTLVSISVLPNKPDIIPYSGPSGSAYNCPPPTTSFTMYNNGGVATGAFTAQVLVMYNNNIVATYNHAVANIAAKQFYGFSIPHIYTALGNYTYELRCDMPVNSGGVVDELNEYNNVASFGPFVLLACKPNLTVTMPCGSQAVQPVDPAPPDMATLTAVISNIGNAVATGPFTVRFAYSTGSIYDVQYNGNLAAGQSANVSVSAPVPASTNTVLTITVDPNDEVDEFSNSDNSYYNNMCHDYQPVPLCGGAVFGGTAYLNQVATPFVGLASHYLYSASQVKVKFEVSGPGITGNLHLGYGILNNVTRNCGCPYVASLPVPFVFSQTGVYTFTMTVDPDNVYLECDEGNNVFTTQWRVINQPDMRVLSQFINPDPLNPGPGQPVSFNISYENLGRTNVNDSMELRLLVNGVAHDSVKVRGLASGDHFTVAMPRTWSSNIPGAHIIRAIIDADKQIAEGDEMNNEATRAIIVGQAANLYFKNLSSSVITPYLGQGVNISALMGNSGSQPCNARVSFYYISDTGDTLSIGQSNFVITAQGDTSVTIPWTVADISTNIIAVISNASVLEYNYEDNTSSMVIGSFNVSFVTSSSSCSGNADGSIAATASGGTAPYFYLWSNGSTDSVLTAAAGIYSVTVTDINGHTITASDTIRQQPAVAVGNITGPVNVCSIVGTANTATYSADNIPGATYTWSRSTNLISLSGTGSSINASFSANFSSGTITVVIGNVCGSTVTRSILVKKIVPATPAVINGPKNPCLYLGTSTNATYSVSPVTDALTYRWTVPANATLVSASTDSTSIEVSYSSAYVTGSITVRSVSTCGVSATRSLLVSRAAPLTPVSITGPTDACPFIDNAQTAVYRINKVANASYYNWTVPPGVTIVSGQGDTSITVSFSSAFVNSSISVAAQSVCGSSGPRSLAIFKRMPSTPGVISGPVDVCPIMGTPSTATYRINRVAFASSYEWILPAEATLVAGGTDTFAVVSFSSNYVTAQISVKAVSNCFTSAARTLSVYKRVPSVPVSISGPADVCPYISNGSALYTIKRVLYASSYQWTLPAGATILSGGTDTFAVVGFSGSFSGGQIEVRSVSNCFTSGPRALSLTRKVPAIPGNITGPTDICPLIGVSNATYSIARVQFATSYQWVIPAGATLVAGGTDTFAVVSFSNSFVSGSSISVRSLNNCSSSALRSLVVFKRVPAVPGAVTAGTPTSCPSRQVSYSIASVLYATSYQWTVPSGATIVSGQGTTSIVVEYPNSSVSDTVRVVSVNNCSVSGQRKLKVTLSACPPLISAASRTVDKKVVPLPNEKAGGLDVEVMPNPSEGEFRLLVRSDDLSEIIDLRIINVNGYIIETKKGVIPGRWIQIGNDYGRGVYFGEIIQGNRKKVVKLVRL